MKLQKIRCLSFGVVAFFTAFVASAVPASAACEVIPLPQKYEEKADAFVPVAGLEKRVSVSREPRLEGVPEHAQNEAYSLSVSKNGVKIRAVTDAGELNARKTLKMLVKNADRKKGVPACKILDWPAYPMRGFTMDCGRSYFPIADLKRIIAFLADYKINVFHWHLTDNQGWRMESRLYPKINDKSSYARDAGKYYTFKEARELVEFCDKLGVLLIPEFDMPGHSEAFRRAFKCDMQSAEGTEILKKLIDEAIREAFPSEKTPYFHIGTDEVHISNKTFVPEMVAFVRERGKKAATWNPGAVYKPGEIDLVQMWSGRGRSLAGTPSVDCRLHYINHFDSFADPVALFFSNFGEKPEADGTIAGGWGAIWCDRDVAGTPAVPSRTDAVLANNSFYPAMLAFAESAWNGGRENYFHDGQGANIPLSGEKLAQLKDFERRMLPVKRELGKAMPWVPQCGMRWRITEPFPNDGDFSRAFPPEKNLSDDSAIPKEYEFDGRKIGSRDARGAGIYLRHTWGTGGLGTVAAFFKNPQKNSTVYAQTWIWSPKAQKIGLWAQTHKYGASEPDLAPPQGEWDYCKSSIWLNGQEIRPPKWTNTHKNKNQEIPLANENFEVRAPIPVNLKQGWNKVVIKLPIGNFSIPQIRLLKWMFTFAPVSADGSAPVDGLVWSPDKKLPEER